MNNIPLQISRLYERLELEPDLLTNKALDFINNGQFANALADITMAINIFNSYHCYYHYQGAVLYHNRGVLSLAESDFKHAIFLYHNQTESIEKQPIFLDPRTHLLNGDVDLLIYKNSSVNKLYEVFLRLDGEEKLTLLNDMISASDAQHLHYHLTVSNAYNIRAHINMRLNRPEFAIVDLNRSLEFDKRNPLNQSISAAIANVTKLL